MVLHQLLIYHLPVRYYTLSTTYEKSLTIKQYDSEHSVKNFAKCTYNDVYF